MELPTTTTHMYPNINTSLGQLMGTQLVDQNTTETTGRFFIVGKASLANISEIKAMYQTYNDGVPVVFTTIALASAACVANRGDVIFLAPGHTESISSATALTMSVAGITVIGLSTGSLRPVITLDTAATATINVTAANITFKNVIFVANFADIATCFTLTTAPEFQVLGCEFRDTASNLNFLAIVTTTVSVNSDGLVFNQNRVAMLGTTAATTPIKVANTLSRITINDNFIVKAALSNTSCVLAHGALVVTNLEMSRNKVFSSLTDSSGGAILITTSSTTNTGMVSDNYIKALDVAAAILVTAGSIYGMTNNLYNGDADRSGFVLPQIGVD